VFINLDFVKKEAWRESPADHEEMKSTKQVEHEWKHLLQVR